MHVTLDLPSVDKYPQRARNVFEDNYQMYCDWCNQMIFKHRVTGETCHLQPVSSDVYFSLECDYA